MALNTLISILEKKGLDYLTNFLNEELTITEKLDTYRILFEKHEDKIIFFKKDNTELNLIERTLTNIWEDAIIELTTIVGDKKLPEGIRFGIAYTPIEKPIRIPYLNIPKYILTDVTLKKNNKVIESYDYEEVNNWAAILNLGKPPIIFSGKLNEEQKETLIKYGLNKFEDLKNINFSKIIENLFKKTYSNQDLIEGITIKSNKDLAQIISYEFNLLNESYQKEECHRDYYDIILLNINKFLDNYNIPILEGLTSEKLYLELISDIFNKFCEKNPLIIEGLKSEYLTSPTFGYCGDLNLLLIKNRKTLEILEKGGKIYEALFKIILSSLRKQRKEYGLLNENAINKFNSYVTLIKHIIKENKEDINEHNNMLDEEFKSENIVINALDKRKPTDIDNMRIIASIQKAFEPSILEIKKGKDNVAVYITECLPFTNSQLENILFINKLWKCPIIIGSISNKRRIRGNEFIFSDLLIKSQLESISIFNKDIILAYFMLGSYSLTEVFEYCRPKYEPIALITDFGKKSEFAIQLYFEDKIMGGRINVNQNFNIGEMDNKVKLQSFRAIEDNLFVMFKENTPQSIWSLWDVMVSEYKTWSGQIKTQFDFQENKF